MKKRFTALLLTTAMTASLLTGCGGAKGWEDGDGKIDGDLTFWTQDTEPWKAYFNPAIKEFQEKYPEVNIQVEYFPEFDQKITQAFSAGEEPDVIQTWSSITDWAKGGKIALIPDSVMSAEELENNYYESALKNKKYEDKYYGIPSEINVESPSLYVNMDILKQEGVELPKSWIENNGPASFSELLEVAEQLTQKDSGGQVTRSGLAYTYAQWEANFLSLILQHGGDYKDEANNQVHFLTEEGRKAAEMLLKRLSAMRERAGMTRLSRERQRCA